MEPWSAVPNAVKDRGRGCLGGILLAEGKRFIGGSLPLYFLNLCLDVKAEGMI